MSSHISVVVKQLDCHSFSLYNDLSQPHLIYWAHTWYVIVLWGLICLSAQKFLHIIQWVNLLYCLPWRYLKWSLTMKWLCNLNHSNNILSPTYPQNLLNHRTTGSLALCCKIWILSKHALYAGGERRAWHALFVHILIMTHLCNGVHFCILFSRSH